MLAFGKKEFALKWKNKFLSQQPDFPQISPEQLAEMKRIARERAMQQTLAENGCPTTPTSCLCPSYLLLLSLFLLFCLPVD